MCNDLPQFPTHSPQKLDICFSTFSITSRTNSHFLYKSFLFIFI